MIAALVSFYTFATNNIKWIAIILVALAAILFGWKYTSEVKANAQLRLENSQLEQVLKEKNAEIKSLEELKKASEKTTKEQADAIENLRIRLNDLAENLGPDSNDQAVESLKELLRRLKSDMEKNQ